MSWVEERWGWGRLGRLPAGLVWGFQNHGQLTWSSSSVVYLLLSALPAASLPIEPHKYTPDDFAFHCWKCVIIVINIFNPQALHMIICNISSGDLLNWHLCQMLWGVVGNLLKMFISVTHIHICDHVPFHLYACLFSAASVCTRFNVTSLEIQILLWPCASI